MVSIRTRACGARHATPAPVGGGFRLSGGAAANAPICRPRKFGQFGGNLALTSRR